MRRSSAGLLLALAFHPGPLLAEDLPLADYFRHETARIAARSPGDADSAEAWQAKRPELQRQLREMMGLDPWPERSPLKATITGTKEYPDFVVETLLYQSAPGLYVTADLYRPKAVAGKIPAILYVCGHGEVRKDGIIYGNKTHYRHHAAWYAANGYVCLIVDTLQLGEMPGLHHGTYRERMWWWFSRGYTPAGIEAWNGIRGIDYLISRPEVDPDRIGVTGRSGGGATTWWIAALDDRVAAAVPVAGITDLRNHVVDGCVQGHCDCMYFVNTYRWDYSTLAALAAPKPLLIENTNRDPIFPEDGVRRIFRAVEAVYGWYGAGDRLGLLIGDGPHLDSIELRHPSFAFFETWLKGRADAAIVEPDRKVAIEELKVLPIGRAEPENQNATIHETFVSKASIPPAGDVGAWEQGRKPLLDRIRRTAFGGWPTREDAGSLQVRVLEERGEPKAAATILDYQSQPGIRLPMVFLTPGPERPGRIDVVLAPEGGDLWGRLSDPTLPAADKREALSRWSARDGANAACAIVFTRGTGPTSWPSAKDAQVRRRFYLLGQTLDGQRVWDVRRALEALDAEPKLKDAPRTLVGEGPMAAVALWAAVFEPGVGAVVLRDPPATVRDGPAFLNLERILDMPQAVALLAPRPVAIVGAGDRAAWAWLERFGAAIAPGGAWPKFSDR